MLVEILLGIGVLGGDEGAGGGAVGVFKPAVIVGNFDGLGWGAGGVVVDYGVSGYLWGRGQGGCRFCLGLLCLPGLSRGWGPCRRGA